MSGRYLLFFSGNIHLAVPLEQVRELVGPERFSDPSSGASGATVVVGGRRVPIIDGRLETSVGKAPEALALVEEKGLTAAIFVDRMAGIREGNSVRERPFPSMLNQFKGGYRGLLESEDDLFLLLDLAHIRKNLLPGYAEEGRAEEEGV